MDQNAHWKHYPVSDNLFYNGSRFLTNPDIPATTPSAVTGDVRSWSCKRFFWVSAADTIFCLHPFWGDIVAENVCFPALLLVPPLRHELTLVVRKETVNFVVVWKRWIKCEVWKWRFYLKTSTEVVRLCRNRKESHGRHKFASLYPRTNSIPVLTVRVTSMLECLNGCFVKNDSMS